ncbi:MULTISPECIES: site-specific integrase [unclassified Ruegeria]|uniref:tyrosine-type recombinase/integrase n=1 Tax=unclassified Ruegeria TaxID=2625375 RepID=UPI001487BB77|nr:MULTISPECIES: site-specific integrase [unclassified Ruegeria]
MSQYTLKILPISPKPSAQRRTLTESKVRSAKARNQRYEINDTDVPGLALRVGTDAKVYILRSRLGTGRTAKRVQIKIGDTRTITLKQARYLARAHVLDLRKGIDPRAPQTGAIHTAQLLALYEQDLIARQIVRTKDMMQSLRKNLHPHRARPIGDLSRLDLTAIIDSIEKSGRPGAAAYFRKNATGFLNYATDKGHIPVSPLSGYRRPRQTRAQRLSGDQWTMTSTDQIVRFLKALSASPDPIFQAYLRFTLLTGQRRNEIAHMRWTELDAKLTIWTITANRTKTGTEHSVPLGDLSRALLKDLAKLTGAKPGKTDTLVFPSARKPDVAMSGWSKRIIPVRKAYEDARLSIHGLRRTFRTGLTELGIDFDTAERMIAHKRPGLSGIYDKSTILERRIEAQSRWEGMLSELEECK